MSIFDVTCTNLENKNALVIEMRKYFTEATTESVLQICVWHLLLKSYKNVCEGSGFQGIFQYISRYISINGNLSSMFHHCSMSKMFNSGERSATITVPSKTMTNNHQACQFFSSLVYHYTKIY